MLKIQKESIKLATENKKCSELYDYVVKELGKYKEYFTHDLGHGVGIEIHEMPNLTLMSKGTIRNNIVFTIEPGVYFPKQIWHKNRRYNPFQEQANTTDKDIKRFINNMIT